MVNLTINNFISDYAERVSSSMEKYVMDAYDSAYEYRTDGAYSNCSYSLLEVCLTIKSDVYKEITDKVRLIANKTERQVFKAKNLPVVSFSCYTDTGVDGSRFYTHTGLMSFDFDDVTDIPLLKRRLLEDRYFKTLACWTSCSGRGVRWVVPFDVGEYVQEWGNIGDVHKRCYMAICDYLDCEYGGDCRVDRSGNLTTFRGLCFLSHDADIYISPCLLGKDDDEFGSRARFKFELYFGDDKEKKKEIECRCVQLSEEEVARKFRQAEDNIELLEQRGLDITYEYDVWYKMAFALVRTFGNKGRELFHRVSALCVSKYDRLECDEKYDSILTIVLNERNNGVNEEGKTQFGTFCYYVKNALGNDFVKECCRYAKKRDLILDGSGDMKGKNNIRKAKKKEKRRVCKSKKGKRNYNKVKVTQKEIEKERLKREVFCWLNDDFERKHLSDAAEMFNLKESTIWNYLKEECKLGHVERVRHGVYVKRFDYAQSA